MKELRAAAQVLGLRIESVAVQGPKGFEEAFGTITQDRADGLIVFPDPLTFTNQELIANFAAKSRISSLFGAKEFVEIGGLMSYGPSYPGMFRRGAYYVDKILKGAKPADLPVEQPTKFELVINLKTAKALGLTIPQSILIRADEVIQ
jgi:putative ABC transport system substrate-binding protein